MRRHHVVRVCVVALALLTMHAAMALAASSRPIVPALSVADDEGRVSLELVELGVRARIVGHLARTEYVLTYRNHTDRQLSGTFRFPLPAGAALSDVGLYFGNVLRRAVIADRSVGRVAYDTVVHRRVDPALAEWTGGSVFRLDVYPIPARGEKRVFVAYDQSLYERDGSSRYVLDLRYGARLRRFTLDVEGDADLAPERPTMLGGAGRWTLRRQEGLLDEVVTLATPAGRAPVALLERSLGDGQWYVSAPLPTTGAGDRIAPGGQVVLLWDESGSAAWQDRAARGRFLQRFLEQQRATELTVVPFHAHLDPSGAARYLWAGGWAPAIRELGERPSLGATDLGATLRALFALSQDLAGDARIVLVTDGLASLGSRADLESAIAELGRLGRRLLVLNASPRADHRVLAHIARATNGWAVDLSREPMEDAVERSMAAPLALHLRGERPLGDVLPGQASAGSDADALVIHARTRTRPLPLVLSVSRTAAGSGREVRLRTRIVRDAPGLVRSAWARARLAAMLDDPGSNAEAMAELGRAHRLLTPRTSFIVLENAQDYAAFGLELPPDLQEAARHLAARSGVAVTERPRGTRGPRRGEPWILRGVVEDESGDAIPGATVMVISLDARTGVVSTNSVADGSFRLAGPHPGPFQVAAELSGFQAARHRFAQGLPSGSALRMTLAVAGMTETINVMAEAPVIESMQSTMSVDGSVVAPAVLGVPKRPAHSPTQAGQAGTNGFRARLDRSVLAVTEPSLSDGERWRRYASAREELAGHRAFHVRVAALLRGSDPVMAARVLTDLVEVGLEEPGLLRVLARVALSWGEPELARGLLDRALDVAPHEVHTWRELILLLARQGRYRELAEVRGRRPSAPTGRARTAQAVLDAELARLDAADVREGEGLDLEADGSAELQVSLTWDTNYSDVDLQVVEPGGETVSYSHARSVAGGWITGDVTDGYGPEMYGAVAAAGEYRVALDYYEGDDTSLAAGTVAHVVIRQRAGRRTTRTDHVVVLEDEEAEWSTSLRMGPVGSMVSALR